LRVKAGALKKVSPSKRPRKFAAMGERIKTRRLEKNLSQEALAQAIGISRQGLSQIEAGTIAPAPGTLASLCSELGVEPFDLIDPATEQRLDEEARAFVDIRRLMSNARPLSSDEAQGMLNFTLRRLKDPQALSALQYTALALAEKWLTRDELLDFVNQTKGDALGEPRDEVLPDLESATYTAGAAVDDFRARTEFYADVRGAIEKLRELAQRWARLYPDQEAVGRTYLMAAENVAKYGVPDEEKPKS
jgi:transcriptional regulator with XRE-family HTH domain